MFNPTANRLRNAAPKKHVDRREERKLTMKSGSICADGADMHLACTIRDIHSSGARMSVINMSGIPESFLLIVRSDNLIARAKVAWKKENEIGVRFLKTGDMAQEEQFRTEQQYNYQKEMQILQQRHQQELANLQAQEQAAQAAEAQRQAQILIMNMQTLGMDTTKPYTEEDVKSAFRRKAMEKHPDQGGDPVEFQHLQEVYNAMLSAFIPLNAQQRSS